MKKLVPLQPHKFMLVLPALLVSLSVVAGNVNARSISIMGGGPVTPPTEPSPSPTPTPPTTPPIDPANSSPVVTTKNLHTAQDGKNYSVTVRGTDIDKADDLNMNITQLPAGLQQTGCNDKPGNKNEIACEISGVPQAEGTYTVMVNLSDTAGHTVQKSLDLTVR